MDSLQQSTEKKAIGTIGSCIYVMGWAEYTRCEGYAVYLVDHVTPGEWYRSQLMQLSRTPRKELPQYEQKHEKVNLLHDNARPNVAKPIKTYIQAVNWEVLPHSLYSPDIVASDYYLFRLMAHALADHQFRSYEDIQKCG